MPSLISNQKCAMSRSRGVCLSADFSIIVCRWVRIMWKKTCFLVRDGAYAFDKLAKRYCVPRLTHGTTLTTQNTYERLPVASRRTRGPIRQYLISQQTCLCWANVGPTFVVTLDQRRPPTLDQRCFAHWAYGGPTVGANHLPTFSQC